jgi:hypothetical protein
MRVQGLKSPGKSLGWLLSLIFFGIAILYPSFPSQVIALAYPGGYTPISAWAYSFNYVFATGGIVWQVISYLRRQAVAPNPWSGRTLFINFSPYCFVPVILPLCALLLWRLLVTHSVRPTIVRGLLAVMCAFASTLLLIFLLDQGGARVLLSILSLSYRGNLEARVVMTTIWETALLQAALFFLPYLAIGSALAWWQRRLNAKSGIVP